MADPPFAARTIVDEIHAEVERKRAAGEYPDELIERVRRELTLRVDDEPLESLADVNPFRPVTSGIPFVARGVVLVKKVIRKSVAWYIMPQVLDQNRFNRRAVAQMRRLGEHVTWDERTWRRRAFDPAFECGVADPDTLWDERCEVLGTLVGKGAVTFEGALMGMTHARLRDILGRNGHVLEGSPMRGVVSLAKESTDLLVAYGVTRYLPTNALIPFLDIAVERLTHGGRLVLDGATPENGQSPQIVDPLMERWMPSPSLQALLQGRPGLEVEILEHSSRDGVRWYTALATRAG